MTPSLPVSADRISSDAALTLSPILLTASDDLITAQGGSDARAMHERYYQVSQQLTQSIALAARVSPDAARELVRVIATLLRIGREEPDATERLVMSRTQGEDAHRALGTLMNLLKVSVDAAVAIEDGKRPNVNEPQLGTDRPGAEHRRAGTPDQQNPGQAPAQEVSHASAGNPTERCARLARAARAPT